jgi:uncharacterized Zn finger protein
VSGVAQLQETFDAVVIHRLTTDRVIKRGTTYHRHGAVEVTNITEHAIEALVQGTFEYVVTLIGGKNPDWSCSCPAAEDGDFCKHCVAVALHLQTLGHEDGNEPFAASSAFASRSVTETSAAREPVREPTSEETWERDATTLRRYVSGMERHRIDALVVELAEADPKLYERLLSEAAGGAAPKLDMDAWIGQIDEAFDSYGDHVDWREADGWADGVRAVLDALDELSTSGHAAAVVAMAGYVFGRIDDAVGYVDDSNSGCLRDLSEQAGQVHLAASTIARPDPVALARQIFELELNSKLDGMYEAVIHYEELLGEPGLAESRRLVDAAGTRAPDDSFSLRSMRTALASLLS